LIDETQVNYEAKKASQPQKNKGVWDKPTLTEMRAFIGLSMLMGIVRNPSIKSYWATSRLLDTPIFSSVMTRDRYHQIHR
jgi:hypothetical protein